MHQVRLFFIALQFFTRIPIPRWTGFQPEWLHQSARYFPLVGAVVGLQPFGGEGLSGTGPKAGGPHYLPRFCVEQTVTVNTAAAGGNVALMTTPKH